MDGGKKLTHQDMRKAQWASLSPEEKSLATQLGEGILAEVRGMCQQTESYFNLRRKTMSKKFTCTGVSARGEHYEGTVTFADLKRADHSAYLTLEREDGTLLSINTPQMEALAIGATREDIAAAEEEFNAEAAAKQQAETAAYAAKKSEELALLQTANAEAGNA